MRMRMFAFMFAGGGLVGMVRRMWGMVIGGQEGKRCGMGWWDGVLDDMTKAARMSVVPVMSCHLPIVCGYG